MALACHHVAAQHDHCHELQSFCERNFYLYNNHIMRQYYSQTLNLIQRQV